MNIGILTFYKVANFGANIQGVSTYYYLKKIGYNPIFLNYVSVKTENSLEESYKKSVQTKAHIDFVNSYIENQTENLYNSDDVVAAIDKYHIDAIIIGSDAVVQHHPLLSRIHKGRRKPFYIAHPAPERMFPNPFWGCGFADKIPTVMMSVSSQNSKYSQFSKSLKSRMFETLNNMKYISVRDTWTLNMMKAIGVNQDVKVTPDPVFAFNYNAGHLVPSEDDIRKRFSLPKDYVLVSLHSQSLTLKTLDELNSMFKAAGKTCVAFPMPGGVRYQHHFDYEIKVPLSSIDWYALIKYASGYVGSNMHPIIVSLHNAVPCFSIDHWGTKDFFNRTVRDGSSKVEHIMGVFGLKNYVKPIDNDICYVEASVIVDAIQKFPCEHVRKVALDKYDEYLKMMGEIMNIITASSQ